MEIQHNHRDGSTWNSRLCAEVGGVRDARHTHGRQRPASGHETGMWSPISSTLIYGKRDAVLVDAFITVEQADALADWVERTGKI